MNNTPLQQAFETCQANKTNWLNKKDELEAAGTALDEQFALGKARDAGQISYLREYIDIKQWEITGAAGRYIRSHEAVQHRSICQSLRGFMVQNGAALVSVFAPEFMGIHQLPAAVSELAIRRAMHYLEDALREYLASSPDIHYTAENSATLTTIGFRPDTASREDYQQKYTPVQNCVYADRRAELKRRKPA